MSLLRPIGSKPTMCYCPKDICQAPKPEWCINNRQCEQPKQSIALTDRDKKLILKSFKLGLQTGAETIVELSKSGYDVTGIDDAFIEATFVDIAAGFIESIQKGLEEKLKGNKDV